MPTNYNPAIHHRRSIRLCGYDYSREGLYFITICCQDRICRFGNVVNGEMILNEFGRTAYNEWLKTSVIRNNVELHEFVIMPNHFHAIVRLCGGGRGESHSPKNMPENRDVCNMPENRDVCNTPENRDVCNTPPRSPSQTIGAIVRGYKSAVTKQLRLMGMNEKLWQRNYYEHIIRDEKSYYRISEYIINNPIKWADDKFYKK